MAQVLTLQRTAGNAHVARLLTATRPVLQRYDGWALQSVTKKKQQLDQKYRFGEQTRTALHHHISRERLDSIAAEVERAKAAGAEQEIETPLPTAQPKQTKNQKRQEPKGKKARKHPQPPEVEAPVLSDDKQAAQAAEEFEVVVNGAVVSFLTEMGLSEKQAQKTIPKIGLKKSLQNMPMNLHYGPGAVAGDPGSSFDRSTVPKAPGSKERVTDPISALLEEVEVVFLQGIREDGPIRAATWEAMTTLLIKAQLLYKQRRDKMGWFESESEQWLEGPNGWLKKGELKIADIEEARRHFGMGTKPLAERSETTPASLATTKLQASDGKVELRLGASEFDFAHFCNRHTYAHFDFNEVKGVNVFWPDGTGRAALTATVQTVMDRLENTVLKPNLQPETKTSTELIQALTDLLNGDGLKVNLGDFYVFVEIPGTSWTDSEDFSLRLRMLAPTGPGYDAYPAEVLTTLARDFGVTPDPGKKKGK